MSGGTQIMIAWLRCFDDDDQRMANRCADALEQAQAKIDRLTNRGIEDMKHEIESLEIAVAHHKEISLDYLLDCDAALRERNTALESTLKSIQKQSGDWYQGAGEDGAAFTMKSIWDQCNEVLGDDEGALPHAWVNQGVCCRLHATPEQRASTMIVCPVCGDKRCARASLCSCPCENAPQSKSQERRLAAQTTNEIPVSTDVGSSFVPNKGNDND